MIHIHIRGNIEELWRTQIPGKGNKLCQSLPHRIEEIIKMKGQNTHYLIGGFKMVQGCFSYLNTFCKFLVVMNIVFIDLYVFIKYV